jgi:hypothetical protein
MQLMKGIYGMCQASRIWNRTFHDGVSESGYRANGALLEAEIVMTDIDDSPQSSTWLLGCHVSLR